MALTKVTTGGITDATIATADIADDAVTTAKVNDSAVTNGKLAADAVTTAKIANSAVTNSKLGDDCVTGSRIADDAINSEHYVDGSIDTAHIADSAVTDAKISGMAASKLTGALPAISGANLTNLPAGGIPASGGTFTGDITVSGGTSAISVSGDSDIRFTNGTDTGVGTKIQHAGNVLRIGGGSNGVEFFNGNTGTSNWKIDGGGRIVPSYNNFFSLGDDNLHITKIFLSQGIQLTGNGTANLLDDYEEGSWTPSVATGTCGAVGNCRYVKIGRMVHITGGISNLSNRTSTSGIQITGFPFALTFIEAAKFTCSLSKFNQQSGGQGAMVDMLHNTSTAYPGLQSNGNQGGPAIRHTDAHNTASSIIFSGTYTTS